MKDGPNIAKIAALLGDTARADALTALMIQTLRSDNGVHFVGRAWIGASGDITSPDRSVPPCCRGSAT